MGASFFITMSKVPWCPAQRLVADDVYRSSNSLRFSASSETTRCLAACTRNQISSQQQCRLAQINKLLLMLRREKAADEIGPNILPGILWHNVARVWIMNGA